jgi:hypothetical protein
MAPIRLLAAAAGRYQPTVRSKTPAQMSANIATKLVYSLGNESVAPMW